MAQHGASGQSLPRLAVRTQQHADAVAALGRARARVGEHQQLTGAQSFDARDALMRRDLLSRMIYGGRTTIFIASIATILSFSLGAFLGFTAAVIGGWIDQLMSRLVDRQLDLQAALKEAI